LILIGDDVDHDPEIYQAIIERFPDRVLAAYIHVVRNRAIPEGLQSYYTAFDLALKEYQAGRMDQTGVHVLAESLLDETAVDFVFPHFAFCPAEESFWQWQFDTEFVAEAYALAQKHAAFCRGRSPK
jgi:hypothetical protein